MQWFSAPPRGIWWSISRRFSWAMVGRQPQGCRSAAQVASLLISRQCDAGLEVINLCFTPAHGGRWPVCPPPGRRPLSNGPLALAQGLCVQMPANMIPSWLHRHIGNAASSSEGRRPRGGWMPWYWIGRMRIFCGESLAARRPPPRRSVGCSARVWDPTTSFSTGDRPHPVLPAGFCSPS